jgi:AraC family transcriptional regulator
MSAQAAAYGDCLGEAFGLDKPPAFISGALRKTTVAITELRLDTPLYGVTDALPAEEAFLVALQVRQYPVHELWLNGKSITAGPFGAGMTSMYDLTCDPRAGLDHPSHAVFFYLPRAALDTIADGADASHVDTLRHQPGVGIDDPVMRHLTSVLLPSFERPEQASTLFIDYVTLAVGAHLAHRYGGMRTMTRPVRGGLAPWQERRAKELMSANLDGELNIAQLAQECELSLSHFTRAFRKTTGLPPHRWLLQRRVDKAKSLLLDPTLSLAETALACGFADQSHFTRVFTQSVGTSPGVWRRQRRA